MTNIDRGRTLRIDHLHIENTHDAASLFVKEHADLIRMSRESIWIVSNTLESEVYLDKVMIAVVEEVQKTNPEIEIEIVIGPEANKESIGYYKKLGAKIHTSYFPPYEQFTIVDEKHVLLKISENGYNRNDQQISHYSGFFKELRRYMPVLQ